MLAKALMDIGDLGMRDALQRRQQDEHGERRLMEMSVQDQIARDRQEWMDRRAETKRVTENQRYDEESKKIIDRKTAGANAEYDKAKSELETNYKGNKDLTIWVGEIEKNRAEFIAQNSKLSEREHGEAAYRAGLLTAKEKGAMDSTVTRNEQQDRRVDLAEDRAKEDMALRKEELELRKRSEGRTSQVAALQLQEAQIKLDQLKQTAKIPPAVKANADRLTKEIETINKTIYDKEAIGQLDAAGQERLTQRAAALSKQVGDLYEPYMPESTKSAEAKGASGSVTHRYDPSVGKVVAVTAPTTTDPAPRKETPKLPDPNEPKRVLSRAGSGKWNVEMPDGRTKQLTESELAKFKIYPTR
jgi:hypothetical protein